VQSCKGGAECRGRGGVEVVLGCRGGEEVVQRRCREGAWVQRWCRGCGEEVAKSAEMLRWCRGDEVVMQRGRGGAKDVQRCKKGAEDQMCRVAEGVQSGAEVQRWFRGGAWCRDGSEVVFLPTTTQILEGIGEVCKNHVLAVPP